MQPILISYSSEIVHLEFLTAGGKADDNRSVNILIVTDHFTKYAQSYVTSKQNSQVITQTLWENFLLHYCCVRLLLYLIPFIRLGFICTLYLFHI